MSDAVAARLSLTLRLACLWLMLQGALYLVVNQWLADMIHLRYQLTLLPYIRQAGIAQLALGLLLRRAVSDPRRQALAVDILLLSLLGKACFMLAFRLSTDKLVPLEWLGLLIDLGLATGLLLWRTRSSQMEQGGALLAKPALAVGKDLKAWAQRKQERPRLDLGSLDPQSAPSPAAQETAEPASPVDPPPSADGPPPPPPSPGAPAKPKPVSEAVPRMD